MELKLIVNVSMYMHLWVYLRHRLTSVTQQVARALATVQKCWGGWLHCSWPSQLLN